MTNDNLWPGWKTVRQVGAGSFGKVYEIQREENGVLRKAALKVMSVPAEPGDVQAVYESGYASTEEDASTYFNSQIESFLQEVTTMEKLKGNRNIVEIQGKRVIPHEGWLGSDILIKMELLTAFSKFLETHPLDEDKKCEDLVLKLGIDICRALEACQAEHPPILHRDIKTANIMVDDQGNFKLGDFGVARVIEGTKSAHTKTGTEPYMAPEVLLMKGYYATADIYSLGIVLYKLLNSNRNPFLPKKVVITADLQQKALTDRLSGKKVPPPEKGSDRLKSVVLKALEYEPKNRYQTAAEFRWALERCMVSDSDEEEESTTCDNKTILKKNDDDIESSDSESETIKGNNSDSTVLDSHETEAVTEDNQNKDADIEQKEQEGTIYGQHNHQDNENRNEQKKLPFLLVITAIVLILAIAIVLVSIGRRSKPTTNPQPTSSETAGNATTSDEIIIKADNTIISSGETTELAVVMGEYTIRRDNDLTWSSSDDSIARVDASGVVTGVSAGSVKITATYQGTKTSVEITVENGDSSGTQNQSANGESAEPDYGDSIEVMCYTTTLLVGDSVYPRVKSGDWYIDSTSSSLIWSSDDPSIGTIDSDGKITGVSPGTFHIIGELEGMTDELEMTIVAVDGGSGATIDVDYESISLSTGGEDTVNVSFNGKMPTHFGATAYYSSGLSLSLNWGEMKDNCADLTIKELFSAENNGEVTIIAYDSDKPTHIVASKKIHIKVATKSY